MVEQRAHIYRRGAISQCQSSLETEGWFIASGLDYD